MTCQDARCVRILRIMNHDQGSHWIAGPRRASPCWEGGRVEASRFQLREHLVWARERILGRDRGLSLKWSALGVLHKRSACFRGVETPSACCEKSRATGAGHSSAISSADSRRLSAQLTCSCKMNGSIRPPDTRRRSLGIRARWARLVAYKKRREGVPGPPVMSKVKKASASESLSP
eukprot:scaffold252714_cov28-Tisochrysis_lutea.AAC.2